MLTMYVALFSTLLVSLPKKYENIFLLLLFVYLNSAIYPTVSTVLGTSNASQCFKTKLSECPKTQRLHDPVCSLHDSDITFMPDAMRWSHFNKREMGLELSLLGLFITRHLLNLPERLVMPLSGSMATTTNCGCFLVFFLWPFFFSACRKCSQVMIVIVDVTAANVFKYHGTDL